MRKVFFLAFVSLLILGCDKSVDKTVDVTKVGEKITLTASIDNTDTRLAISAANVEETSFNHFWQGGDQIRVFDGAGNSAAFDLDGYEPLSPSSTANFSGTFAYTPIGAVYPAANASAAFDGTDFTVTFPATQTYTANTYDPAANVYVATIDGSTLTFKPLMCYVRIALYSDTPSTAVDHIVLTSLDGGKIAGLASVDTDGNVTMKPSAGSSITLNCAGSDAISTDSAAPTYFYIAVPAVAASGLKIDVYKSDDSHLWRNVVVSPLDKKNRVLKMGALEYSPVPLSSTAVPKMGGSINTALKTLAAGTATTYKEDDASITKIIIETNKNLTGISEAAANTVKLDSASTYPIYATLKDNTITIQTNAPTITLRRSNYLFQGFTSVKAIEGLSNVLNNTSSFSANMFRRCSSLESLDLSATLFNGYIRDASHMFDSCMALASLTLPTTSWSVNNTSYMFKNCRQLKTIPNLDKISSYTSLTNVSNMFLYCVKLNDISFGSGFTCSTVTNFSNMFYGCIALEDLSLQYFNTSAATNMDYMFYNIPKLTSLTLGENFISSSLAPAGFFFGSSSASNQQTAGRASDGFLDINCTEATGQWLIKTNLRNAHPTHSTFTTKVDTKFHIWNNSTKEYEYKTVYSKLGSLNDYASSTKYIYWPSTASDPADLNWTGDSGESEAQASTTEPVASYGAARTGGVSF